MTSYGKCGLILLHIIFGMFFCLKVILLRYELKNILTVGIIRLAVWQNESRQKKVVSASSISTVNVLHAHLGSFIEPYTWQNNLILCKRCKASMQPWWWVYACLLGCVCQCSVGFFTSYFLSVISSLWKPHSLPSAPGDSYKVYANL